VHIAPTGKVFRFTGTSFDRFEDRPAGAALDTNTFLPARWEYRASDTAFLKSNVFVAWVAIEQITVLNIAKKHIQFRVTLHSNHTNT
jgi:hypothetical protein